MVNIALCYAHQMKLVEANDALKKGYLIHESTPSPSFPLHASYAFGLLFYLQQNYQQAESQLLKCFNTASKDHDIRFQMNAVELLTKIYLATNQLQKAENFVSKGERLLQQSVPYNLDLADLYLPLAALYERSKNFKKALYYQSKYISLKDSIFGQKLTTNLMRVEAAHLQKENNSRIESQNEILALNKQMIAAQLYLNVFTAIIALLLGILTFALG